MSQFIKYLNFSIPFYLAERTRRSPPVMAYNEIDLPTFLEAEPAWQALASAPGLAEARNEPKRNVALARARA
jgi:hypothetical protein